MVVVSWKVFQRGLCSHHSRSRARLVWSSSATPPCRSTQTLDEAGGGNGLRLEPHHSGDRFLPRADADRSSEARNGLGSIATPLRFTRLILATLSRPPTRHASLREDVLVHKRHKSTKIIKNIFVLFVPFVAKISASLRCVIHSSQLIHPPIIQPSFDDLVAEQRNTLPRRKSGRAFPYQSTHDARH